MQVRRFTAVRGFTLIELMIVVAIVAILAAVAYPSYRDSVLKGRRAEARAALAELLLQQERYMTQRNTYLAFSAGNATVPFKTFAGDRRNGTSYLLGAAACSGQAITECVRVFAQPQQADADAGELGISSTGARDCSGSKPQVCWR